MIKPKKFYLYTATMHGPIIVVYIGPCCNITQYLLPVQLFSHNSEEVNT